MSTADLAIGPAPAAPGPTITLTPKGEYTPRDEPSPHGLLEHLVRSPAGFAARAAVEDPARLARVLLATLAAGAGAFGAVLGAHRGGVQVLYCAVKLPLLLLVTLVVCTPAFVTIARAAGTGQSARGVVTLTLAASARAALVLAGLAPVLWLLEGVLAYHGTVLASVAACAVAGGAAAALLFAGLGATGRGAARTAGLAFVAVYALVGAQSAWLLRPFVVRPRTHAVPFVRAIEGDLLDAIGQSARSAAGIYNRAPAPGAPAGRCEGASCE